MMLICGILVLMWVIQCSLGLSEHGTLHEQTSSISLAELPAVAINIDYPFENMRIADLAILCPQATGEIRVVADGKWVLKSIGPDSTVSVPSGPMLCYIEPGGINLGHGYAMSSSSAGHRTTPPPITGQGVESIKYTPDLGIPMAHFYEVEVTNILNGKSGRFVALADSGSSRAGNN
jgi:hypothetical protein